MKNILNTLKELFLPQITKSSIIIGKNIKAKLINNNQ